MALFPTISHMRTVTGNIPTAVALRRTLERVTRAEANTLLAPIALERARVLAPFVLLGMIASLIASEPAGIPLSPIVVLFNVAMFVLFETLRRTAQGAAEQLAQQLAVARRSEDERSQLHEQLLHAQRMEAAGTLAAGLAHDMNNVLASIMTFTELLRDDLRDPAHRADLDQIVTQAERGAQLTRALLAFSRRGQYRKKVLRIEDVLVEVLPLLERTLPNTIELKTVLD